MNNSFERQTETDSSDIEMKMQLWPPKWRCGSERQNENAALNAQQKMNNGFERQTENERYDGYECWTRNKQWLWTSKWNNSSER